MHPLFQNKFVRLGLVAIGALISLFIVLFVLTNLSSNSLGLKGDTVGVGYAPMAPSYQNSMGRDALLGGDEGMIVQTESSFYYAPEPLPDGYTSGLESYETTNYSISARTKEFDALCGALAALKNDPQIHFKNLTSSINSCYATFYVAPEKVEGTLHTLTAFGGVEVNRNTESVTRHKQQLESQTAILQQQLARVESSLTAAQTQLDRLNQVFNSSDEVTRLSGEVTKSLQYIDQLTERKIRLISISNRRTSQSA
jgi:hypothetical protein